MNSEAPKVFESWRDLMTDLNKLSEDELRNSINFEVSTYGRASFIKRMHMRYEKLRSIRERRQLINRETLL